MILRLKVMSFPRIGPLSLVTVIFSENGKEVKSKFYGSKYKLESKGIPHEVLGVQTEKL